MRLNRFLWAALFLLFAHHAFAAPKKNGKQEAISLIKQIENICQEEKSGDPHVIFEELAMEIHESRTKLMSLGSVARQPILDAIKDKKRDWKMRYFLAETFEVNRATEAIPSLMRLLNDRREHHNVRQAAGKSLLAFGAREAENAIKDVVLASDTPVDVRRGLMVGVGAYGMNDMAFLQRMVEGEVESWADAGFHFNAIRAMGHSKNPDATRVLLELLDRYPSDSLSKGVVIEALDNRRDPQAIDPLIKILLNDPDRLNRKDAAKALGNIGDKRTVPDLIRALGDPYDLVVMEVAEALRKLKDRRALPALEDLVKRLPTDGRFSEYYDKDTQQPVSGQTVTTTIVRAYQELSAQ